MRVRTPMNLAGLGLVTVVFVDLATKVAASELASNETTGAVVPVRNHEFSLGIAGAGLTTTIGLAAIGIVIAAALMWAPTRRGELAPWIPATVVGGALANLVDRILFGSVHDFLATPWIVFNVADVAVAAGLIGLIVTRLRHHHASSKAREVIPCEPTLPA